jgi:hypothetical protein
LPRVGAWHALVELDAAEAPAPGASAALAGERLALAGTVRDAGTDPATGRATARVVGGAGGLARTVAARQYRAAPLRVLLTDLARDAGEALDAASDPATLASTPPLWTRAEGAAGDALAAMLAPVGASWRMTRGGALWVGREAWAPATLPADAEALGDDPTELTSEYRAAAPFAPEPGTTISGRRVSRVSVTITPDATRVRVWWERDGIAPGEDRVSDPLSALVRAAVRDVLYHALIPATVLAHDADGTLQVQPEAPRFPPLVGVAIRPTCPGLEHRVTAGARVLLAFEGGDPARPVAVAFAPEPAKQSSVTLEAATTIKLGASATRGVARADDAVDCGALVYVPGVPGALSYRAPGAVAFVPVAATPPGTALRGRITGSSAKVKAE